MHRRWTVVLSLAVLLTILAGSAAAQIPTKGNVFFGYSYNRAEIVSNDGTNLNGWNASLEGKFAPWVGLVADLGGTYGNHISEHNFLFGPRLSVEVKGVRPFAELLIGAGHIGIDHGPSDTSFANAVGGGVDYRVAGPVAARGQLDWIRTRFFDHDQNDWRFSTGLVVHF
jgi:opacity protein-like surface antigen